MISTILLSIALVCYGVLLFIQNRKIQDIDALKRKIADMENPYEWNVGDEVYRTSTMYGDPQGESEKGMIVNREHSYKATHNELYRRYNNYSVLIGTRIRTGLSCKITKEKIK